MKAHEFCIKRVYDTPLPDRGARFLVDRVWPRGVRKETLELTAWLKEVAPSTALRKWFGHEPDKWPEFRRRYRSELAKAPAAWTPLLATVRKQDVILLYSAKDPQMNQAVVLKEFLEEHR